MLVAAALGLALTTAPAASDPTPPRSRRCSRRCRAVRSRRRLLGLRERFLGTPYAHSPLGEGEGPDPDPRLRLDRVDCLTYVETVMALALSGSVEDVVHVLDSIRYRTRPDYAGRNHLMEAEWLPSNAAKGLVRDVTVQLAGERPARAEGDWRRGLGLHHRARRWRSRPPRA